MAVPAQFTPRVLSRTIQEIKRVKTNVLDKVFGNRDRQVSAKLEFDVVHDTERILTALSSEASARTEESGKKTNVVIDAPRFATKRRIKASRLGQLRADGTVDPEILANEIARIQADMRNSYDRTREFMAVKAITTGIVTDGSGVELVDYGLAAGQLITLVGNAQWSDLVNSDPSANIETWKKVITDEIGAVDGFAGFIGEAASINLTNNQKVRDLIKNQGGVQLLNDGRLGNLGGVEIDKVPGTYLDSAGTRFDMMNTDMFVLVGLVPDGAAELFAPTEDFADPNGVGKGRPASEIFSKMWEQEDPSGLWIKAESKPLPVLLRPGIIVAVIVQ